VAAVLGAHGGVVIDRGEQPAAGTPEAAGILVAGGREQGRFGLGGLVVVEPREGVGQQPGVSEAGSWPASKALPASGVWVRPDPSCWACLAWEGVQRSWSWSSSRVRRSALRAARGSSGRAWTARCRSRSVNAAASRHERASSRRLASSITLSSARTWPSSSSSIGTAANERTAASNAAVGAGSDAPWSDAAA
jgi:hypothetical protein